MERLLKALSEYERRVLEALIALKVNVRVYRMRGTKGDVYVIVGGLEGIFRFEYKDVDGELKEALEDACDDDNIYNVLDGDIAPFFITKVTYDVGLLEKIVKYESVKTLSKTQIEAFKDGNESSLPSFGVDLEDKIVYIHEREPSTNTLSLTKQFDLKHLHVKQFIFKGIESHPSILTHIDIDIYQYKGNGKAINTSIYYELDEHAYTEFLENMGTPKSSEMRILRYLKKREYFDGFIRLKEHACILGYDEQNLIDIIGVRTLATKTLFREIGDYCIRMSNVGIKINPVDMIKTILNIVNYRVGIDPISYKESNNNRANHAMKQVLKVQEILTSIEDRASALIYKSTLNPSEWVIKDMAHILEVSEDDVINGLNKYKTLNTYSTLP